MTKAQRHKDIAKALYLSGKSIEDVANIMELNTRTIQGYKAKDLKAGIDWDSLRVVKYLDSSQKDQESIYADFVQHMYEELRLIREDKSLKNKDRVEAISRLGDSFSKMRRIAAVENPEAYTHGIIKATITKMITIIKPSVSNECLNIIADKIAEHQEDLADVSI